MVKDLEKKQFLTYDEQITFLEEKKDLIVSKRYNLNVVNLAST